MKTFCFFSPKGGVGKTTLTILFAAYLSYQRRQKVKVMDAECPKFPIQYFRNTDLSNACEKGSPLYNYLALRKTQDPYVIESIGKPINTYSQDDIKEFAWKVNEEIRKDRYDYLLLDFPAGYSETTPVSCLVHNHLIDSVFIPFSTESQERMDAYKLGRLFLEEKQHFRLVWNRVNKKYTDNPGILERAEQDLYQYGLMCSKTRIKMFNKAAEDSDVRCFIRNTLCWPERYVQMYCPELIGLFEEIIEMLDEVG